MLKNTLHHTDGAAPVLCITIRTSSPEEQKQWLIRAVSSSLRWYAMDREKRPGDDENAIVLIDFMQVLQAMK